MSIIQKYRTSFQQIQRETNKNIEIENPIFDTDEDDALGTSLTSAMCLSMTCGCFTLMCGIIGLFYFAEMPEHIRPRYLKKQADG